jgi:hypothetical protein
MSEAANNLIANIFERRVPQFLAIYAGASWVVVEFADFMVEEFLLTGVRADARGPREAGGVGRARCRLPDAHSAPSASHGASGLDDSLGLIAESGNAFVEYRWERRVYSQGRRQVAVDPGYDVEQVLMASVEFPVPNGLMMRDTVAQSAERIQGAEDLATRALGPG